jgi:hypothetical protein
MEDFSTAGGFIANVAGYPPGGWVHDPVRRAWYADGSDGFPGSEKALTSPRWTVTRSGNAQISFAHRYSFESGYDGGQLRVSVNGAPFRPVAGEVFTQNGYTDVLFGFGPVYEQEAFSGDSTGYFDDQNLTCIADLGYFAAGDTLAVRFLGGWDAGVKGSSPNWLLDGLVVTEGNPGRPATTFSIRAHASLGGAEAALSYQWQRDSGAGFVDIVGANANDYTFVPAPVDNGSRFRCLLYAPGSTATSAVVTLTIVLPALSIVRTAGNIILSWQSDGVLQEASSISGSWTDVPGTSNPRTLPAPPANRFYRLRGM